MPITIVSSPTNLTWANFGVTPNRIVDPADNTLVDAYTTFRYTFQNLGPRTMPDGRLAFPEPWTITISPNASVWNGVQQTADLLSHEQWHYDVGIVTARALARRLSPLRGANRNEMLTHMNDAIQLHFITRAGILQKRYDLDTRHGTQAHYQGVWKRYMTSCLADPNADTIGGFYL